MTDLPTIYCLNSGNWEKQYWIDRHYLMLGLASRGWPVVYSQGPLSVWDRGSSRWRNAPLFGSFETWKSDDQTEIILDRPGKFLARFPRVQAYDAFARRNHAKRLLRAGSNGPQGNAIGFLCHPRFAPYADYLGLRHIIFHIHDAYWKSGNWTEANQLELEGLAGRANWIFGLSDTMLRNLPPIAANKKSVLPQAVYADTYIAGAARECPTDLAQIPHPRIGYMGRISRKVDLELVFEVATRKPNLHWVFVGEARVGFVGDQDSHDALDKCAQLNNVHFLGPRAQKDMPAYMAHMDVNTMCYRASGGQWEAGNPLKMFEYLAVGKPVVGTGLENVRRFGHVVDIPETTDQWIAAIERGLTQGGVGTVEQRRAVALENTWEKVVDQLENKLLELIQM